MLSDFSKRECLAVFLSFLAAVGAGGWTAKLMYAAELGSDQMIRHFGAPK